MHARAHAIASRSRQRLPLTARRDLKPENVMVNEATGHVVLIDFDLAAPRLPPAEELALWADTPLDEARAAALAFDAAAADGGAACSVDASRRSIGSGVSGGAGGGSSPDGSPRGAAAAALVAATARAAGADAAAGAQARMFAGTAEYAAPEVVCGAPHGAAADVWQLGVLLYELLYGHTPFRGRFDERTFYNVVAAPLATPPLPPRRRRGGGDDGGAEEDGDAEAEAGAEAGADADADADADAADAAHAEGGAHAVALLRAMLARTGGWQQPSDPRVRLGGGGGAAEVRAHPFFAGVDWATLPWAPPPCLVAPVRLRGSSVNLADVTLGAED
jgi:serine/threonine protein kinase